MLDVDAEVLRWMHAHATPHGLAFFAFVSLLGSPGAMTLVGLAASGTVWWRGDRRVAVGYLLLAASGGLLNRAIKLLVHRARPAGALEQLVLPSYSFPSGHTMGTTIGIGLLYLLIVRTWPLSRAARRGLLAGCTTFVLLVGASRVYLGAHYLTDVLGGLGFGLLWIGLGIALLRRETGLRTPGGVPAVMLKPPA